MLTIYKASAGSGKTYTLTYEYIRTLLGIRKEGGGYALNIDKYALGGRRQPNRHRAIMAITFTNAATDEMKQRIIREVATLARDVVASPYTKALTALYVCSAAELSEAARHALAELLLDYSTFNVSTIDSFFQSVLRTFSREMDRQGDYELVLDRQAAIKQAISLMLDELNYAAPDHADRLLDWLQSHTLEQVTDGGAYNFFDRNGSLLSSLAKSMDACMTEEYYSHAKALEEYFADPSRIQTFERELSAHIKAANDAFTSEARRLMSFISAHGLTADHIKDTVTRPIVKAARNARLLQSKDFNFAAFTKEDYPPDKIIGKLDKLKYIQSLPAIPGADGSPGMSSEEFIGLLCDFCHNAMSRIKQREFYNSIRNSLGQLDFIAMAAATLERMLRESNTMLLSNTADLINHIISGSEVPFIYERLNMRLESLLIDEFQDTSALQWDCLRPLVGNSVAEGFDNLIIGDEKQSIYRFRNSDSELLGSQVPNVDFPHHIARGHAAADNTNHRSAGDVVRFNNTLFYLWAPTLGAKAYGNVVQAVDPKYDELPAYVRVDFTDRPAEESYENMAQDILRQHEAGYRWSDIMVLARTRKEINAIISFLLEHHPDISVMSTESLYVDSSPAVRAVLSMLKLVARSYQGDEVERHTAAGSYGNRADVVLMTTRYEHFASRSLAPEEALAMALGEGDDGSDLMVEIASIRAKNPSNIVALIDAIIAEKLTPEQRSKDYAYLAALQDYAVAHSQSPDPSLAAFLAQYDRNPEAWTVGGGASVDAVKVMTIHKSKGLEAQCVHIPDGNFSMSHNSLSMWVDMTPLAGMGFTPDAIPPAMYLTSTTNGPLRTPGISPFVSEFDVEQDKETTDNLNSAYVAFTRARRELIIQYRAKRNDKNRVLDLVRPLFDSAVAPVANTIALADYMNGDVFCMGAPTTAIVEDKSGKNRLATEAYEVCYREDTRELVQIDDALAIHDADADEEDKEIVDRPPVFEATPAMLAAAQRGTHLHAILGSMRTLADLEASLQWQCARERIDIETADQYRLELLDAIAAGGSRVQEWFADEASVLPERSIFVPDDRHPDGGTSIRPDRVVMTPDGRTVVVDYKFTRGRSRKHSLQVQVYMAALAAMGYGHIEGYLWYPARKEIVPVPESDDKDLKSLLSKLAAIK
ncbi:MAG: UvrD-helicase domain-containing protein [Muribaculaceae bacterium]|nr:UvrD-helicase domain-containing protein [Muribaculaceae bacterium]